MPRKAVDRRTVLGGGATLAAAGLATAACGGGAAPAAAPAANSTVKATAIGDVPPVPASTDAAAALNQVTNTADVPVGSGLIIPNQKVVVTQPAAGQFKAFSAICTHQGCTVATVNPSGISCPCHGSVFSVKDGSVVNGPAKQPLAEKKVTVNNGGTLTIADS